MRWPDLLLAQALAERGVLDGLASSLDAAWSALETTVRTFTPTQWAIAAGAAVGLWLLRRR